jgi:hypothetical protein
MATRSKLQIEQSLKKKGFICERGRDHLTFTFYLDGKRRARTYISHGSSSGGISSKLISDMANQCFLTKKEFLELVDCTLSQKQYTERLHEQLNCFN